MNTKIKWLRDKIRLLDMQGMIVSNPVNIKYLTNIDAEGVLLITRKENIFITDGRYIEVANSTVTIDDEIIVCNIKDISKDDYENFFNYCENVGFEENYITYAEYKEYIHKYKINNFEETESIIEKQRMIKDEEEIRNLRKACSITDDCFDHLKEFIKIGMTEKEVALEIERFFKLNGADGLSFDSIVASGRNSSMPHAVPTDKKIEAGDPITIDFGCKYKGYCSDMTRTFFYKEVSQKQKEVYNLVLKANEAAEAAIKPGMKLSEIDAVARNIITEAGYGKEFNHRLGHFIGKDVHEFGDVSSVSDIIAKPGMIFSIEPGVYLQGDFGVRIEDLVMVTEDGCKVLNSYPKELTVIE